MGFDASDRESEAIDGKAGDDLRIFEELAGPRFHKAPGAGGLLLDGGIAAGQTAVVGANQIAALSLGDGRHEVVPGVGEDLAGTVLIEPLRLAPRAERYPRRIRPRQCSGCVSA